MSAIATISAALGYDAIESALVTGSLADAMIAAAAMCSGASVDNDVSPESFAPTSYPMTVRPGKSV